MSQMNTMHYTSLVISKNTCNLKEFMRTNLCNVAAAVAAATAADAVAAAAAEDAASTICSHQLHFQSKALQTVVRTRPTPHIY